MRKILLRSQRGYLMEIPLLLIAVGITVAVVLPHLPPLGRRILLGLAAVPALFCMFYMIVTPGWQPSDKKRLKWPWSLLVFLILALAILTGVVMLFVSG